MVKDGELSSLRLEMEQGMFTLIIFIQHSTGGSGQGNWQEEKIKDIQIGENEVKFLVAVSMIYYTEYIKHHQ